jgi:hypothetical protein
MKGFVQGESTGEMRAGRPGSFRVREVAWRSFSPVYEALYQMVSMSTATEAGWTSRSRAETLEKERLLLRVMRETTSCRRSEVDMTSVSLASSFTQYAVNVVLM